MRLFTVYMLIAAASVFGLFAVVVAVAAYKLQAKLTAPSHTGESELLQRELLQEPPALFIDPASGLTMNGTSARCSDENQVWVCVIANPDLKRSVTVTVDPK